jgi:hypothetical protein
LTDFSITRDYWDRPYVTQDGEPLKFVSGRKSPVNAQPYTRISTMAGTLDDKGGLLDYYAARAMLGIVKNDALYAKVSHLASAYKDAWKSDDGKKPLKDIVKKAMSAGGADNAADLGTAAHGIWECIDNGQEPEFTPPWLKPWTQARQAALEDFEPVLVEPFVVCDQIQTAGSPDRYLRHKPTGVVYAADDKTGDDEPKYPLKVTIQVAIASRAVLYDQRTGTRTPIDCDQSRGILIHTPINTAEPRSDLYWLDLTKGWELALLAYKVREERKVARLEKVR